MQLKDRVNEQFVKDAVKEAELKISNKVKEGMAKSAIDPALIDSLQSKSTKLEKELEMKAVELAARISEVRDLIEINLPTRKEFNE